MDCRYVPRTTLNRRLFGRRCACVVGLVFGILIGLNGATIANFALQRSLPPAAVVVHSAADVVASQSTPTFKVPAQCDSFLRAITADPDKNWRRGVVHKMHSQFGQDAALFYSIFARDYVDERGALLAPDPSVRRRTFIDLATNHWRELSNTLFFEECLGWRGVCIEPDAGLAGLIAKNRPRCALVEKCVMDAVIKVQFASAATRNVMLRGAAGVIGIVGATNTAASKKGISRPIEMECTTLDAVVKGFAPAGGQRPAANERAGGADASGHGKKFHIDFLSLDIEGAEPQALRGVDWASTQIDVILAEAKSDTTNAGGVQAATALIPLLEERGCVSRD